jgi:hypothetical protein
MNISTPGGAVTGVGEDFAKCVNLSASSEARRRGSTANRRFRFRIYRPRNAAIDVKESVRSAFHDFVGAQVSVALSSRNVELSSMGRAPSIVTAKFERSRMSR